MLLLGYGLVGIPRTLWREADIETCLKRCLHRQAPASCLLHPQPEPSSFSQPRLLLHNSVPLRQPCGLMLTLTGRPFLE